MKARIILMFLLATPLRSWVEMPNIRINPPRASSIQFPLQGMMKPCYRAVGLNELLDHRIDCSRIVFRV
jgi:hypothetical protein